jgi:hypothetical protein
MTATQSTAAELADAAAIRHVTVLKTMRDCNANPAMRAWAKHFLEWYGKGRDAGRLPGSAMAWAREQMAVYHSNAAMPVRS